MIRHLALFKVKPRVSRDDPRVAERLRHVAELPKKIPTTADWKHSGVTN